MIGIIYLINELIISTFNIRKRNITGFYTLSEINHSSEKILMKSKLLYSIIILLVFSCKTKIEMPVKIKKIAAHTFTGTGSNGEITNWFYVRNIADRGFSGYYLESASVVSDFKQANFIYSKIRPIKFETQAASNEKLQLVNPGDLPRDLLKDASNLESLYESPAYSINR